jgi:hypothetical protein
VRMARRCIKIQEMVEADGKKHSFHSLDLDAS